MPDSKKNRVTVEIHGHNYTMKGDAPAEHLKQVAQFVDQKMKQISDKNPALDSTKLAVLTALNVADDLFRLQGRYEELLANQEKVEKE